MQIKDYVRLYEHFMSPAWARSLEALIPEEVLPALVEYILEGAPLDGFLKAVVTNDLRRAVKPGDVYRNDRETLLDYAVFFEKYAPKECCGNPRKYEKWVRIGGWLGFRLKAEGEEVHDGQK